MMYSIQPKKLLIMNILDVLSKYSDAEHRLSQTDIIDILRTEYDMNVERKAVKRNLMNLIDFGYDLEYSEAVRKNKQGEEETIYTNWYLERDFSNAELRLLIDSLLFSKHIPYSQCKSLIKKIEGLSNQYFRSKVSHICNLPENLPENRELFFTIELLDEAIEKNRQVEFIYADYKTDMRLHPRTDNDGAPHRYLVNPYQMVATNGRYYLIANYDTHDDISHYRLDRIMQVSICDTPAKPQRRVKGMEYGLNLPQHMAEHIYMFSGQSRRVSFRAQKYIVGEIIDWFGKDVLFSNETDEEVTATVKVNLHAMRYWAMQYAPHIRVLSPQSLVEQIRTDLLEVTEKYK